jgi:cyclopropane fatty-acyl-phospholipid synthase-like methyltransferase
VVELADRGLLMGDLIDVGCGTGEHTILAAACGASALGVDLSPVAIELATEKARTRHSSARFSVVDARALRALGQDFDVVLDSGLFHVFESDADRQRYTSSLADVVRLDGTVYVTCISDRQEGDWGPHRVTEQELRVAFRDEWVIEDLRPCVRETRRPEVQTWAADAWLATVRHAKAPRERDDGHITA